MKPDCMPPGATPLRELMFAHPRISEAVVEALGPDGFAGDQEITLDKERWGRRWTRTGCESWEVRVSEEPAGGWNWEGEKGEIVWSSETPHWVADERAWEAATKALGDMLQDGSAYLIGRPGSPLAPLQAVPLDALPQWADQAIDYQAGSFRLDVMTVYSVHIVAPRSAPENARGLRSTAASRAKSEAELKNWIIAQAQNSPTEKTHSLATLRLQYAELQLTKGAVDRAWSAAMTSLDPQIRAVWQSGGTLRKANRSPQSIPEI